MSVSSKTPARSSCFTKSFLLTRRAVATLGALAQHILLHLSRRRARQLADDLEPLGPIMFGDLTGVEIVLHLIEIEARSAAQHDKGAGTLAQARIRHRDDRDVVDRGMIAEQLFDLGRPEFFRRRD